MDWALWKKRLDPVMVAKYEEAYKGGLLTVMVPSSGT